MLCSRPSLGVMMRMTRFGNVLQMSFGGEGLIKSQSLCKRKDDALNDNTHEHVW